MERPLTPTEIARHERRLRRGGSMRRSTTALWVAFVFLAGVSVCVVGQFGWFANRPVERAAPGARAGVALEDQVAPSLQPDSDGTSDSEQRAPERQPVDVSPAEERAVFRLVDGAGEPARGARILVARGEELLFEGKGDERGEVALDRDDQEAQLVAWSWRRPMQAWTVRLDGGLHEFVLADGARVAGRLEREDGGDAEGMRLLLISDRPLLPLDPVPEVVWQALGLEPSQATVLAGETGSHGSFEFGGLPATWSGELRLGRGWRARSASHGELEPLAGSVRLANPVEDLLVVLAARAELRGRLLRESDGTPLVGAMLVVRLRAPGVAEPENLQAQADDEGRFELASTHAAIQALDLRLGGTREPSTPIVALEGPAVPPDGELGDLFVAGVRDVPFLLHERGGAPIRGGFAQAAGMQSAPTGSDGRSVLRWVPESARRLWAEASGFVPAEVELGPALPDPLRIQLEPASALEVRLIPPEGSSLEQFKVVVRREEGVAAGPLRDQAEQRAYVGAWALPTADLWNAPKSSYLVATAEEPDGVARFRALALGVPLELEVRGLTGPAVYHRRMLEPFRAGERRRLEIALGEGLVDFRGRVIDEAGQPLAGAMLQLDGGILGWTDEKGAFLFFLVDAGPGTLVVQHESCSTLFLHDYVVPAGGQEIELRLRPARHVTIEVVDAGGEPVPEAEVWILQEGFVTNTDHLGDNRHVARSLTDNPFRIETRVGGRKYVQEHSSDRADARVVVPVHGSVRAQVSDATTHGRAGKLLVVLTPAEGQPGDPLVAERASAPDLAIELRAVPPGSYQAALHYVPTDDERAAGRQEEASPPQSITVLPRQSTEIRLEL